MSDENWADFDTEALIAGATKSIRAELAAAQEREAKLKSEIAQRDADDRVVTEHTNSMVEKYEAQLAQSAAQVEEMRKALVEISELFYFQGDQPYDEHVEMALAALSIPAPVALVGNSGKLSLFFREQAAALEAQAKKQNEKDSAS